MLLNVYNRYDLVLEKGQGSYVYDNQGRRYLDFVSGISVNCLGHSSPIIQQALQEQSAKLIHISNLYYSEPQLKLAEKLITHSAMERVFFTNSGTEAVELAIKIARKFGRQISENKTEIVYMHNSFHGRSTGALAITGQKKYQQPFAPLIPNVRECPFNDCIALRQQVNDNTAAIILEPVQGESGLESATSDFIETLSTLRDQHQLLLIFDEIQCGMGRMGTLFAYEQFGLIPDVITIAKSLGGGLPIGACLTRGTANEVLIPGDHGSTYGGNPLVCAVANAVLTELVDNQLITRNVVKMGTYAKQQLLALQQRYDAIEEVRGQGLLLGLKLHCSKWTVNRFVSTALAEGLLLVGAGNNVVRYFPPFNVSKSEIDESLAILAKIFQQHSH